MATAVLGAAIFALVPVAIGWRVSLNMLKSHPTPELKLAFWVLSGLFVALAGVAFVATRFI